MSKKKRRPAAPRRKAKTTEFGAAGAAQQPSEYRAEADRPPSDAVQIAFGPQKPTPRGVPPPRLSNHKARASWFQARSAWPFREAPVARVVAARDVVAKSLPQAAGNKTWEGIGPRNIGGRVTCVVTDPADANRVWIGAAGGGVWHSSDGAQTWETSWSDQDVLNIGALAIDPVNHDILYCGTGEANLSADSYPGVGLYRSIDGGATWHLHASCDRDGLPRRIGVIAVDPFDVGHIVIGGVGLNEVSQSGDLGGLYASRDGGVTWQRETFGLSGNYWCHTIVFHPLNRSTIFVSITAMGAASGIYRTEDGGATWSQLRTGLPAPEAFGRTALAISPSTPDVIYAFAADERSGRADRLLGVFKSLDSGRTWNDISGVHFEAERQISYGNTIVVHPQDAAHVVCGGVDLHVSTDGGQTWTQTTKWNATRGSSNYAHADHHGLCMPAAAPGRLYDVNDGGVDVSADGGMTWTNRSNGLAITMYYDMDVAQGDARVFGGGAQDNGTLITVTGRSDDHFQVLGGDGGWIVFDPLDASHLFASYYNLNVFRFHGNTWKDVSPPADEAEKNAIWMGFLELDPSNPSTLYAGSTRVWRTTDDGESWAAISAVLDGSPISALEIARSDPRRIYIGTEYGGVFRSVDAGRNWSANIATSVLPGHTITRLVASPNDPNQVFATIANFGHSHIFRSDDGGSSWTDVDRGQLPDAPHHAIAIPPDRSDTIYVCSDAGVFESRDAGLTWANLTGNLPHVMVIDLVWHTTEETLSAATYGRGLFRLRPRRAA